MLVAYTINTMSIYHHANVLDKEGKHWHVNTMTLKSTSEPQRITGMDVLIHVILYFHEYSD